MNNDSFDRLRYPVHKYEPDHDLSSEPRFRQIFNYQEFKDFGSENEEKQKYLNKLIRYICFLYDPESPFQHDYQNLLERKEAAATAAGFNRDTNEEWPEHVEGFFNFQDKEVVSMILRFLKIFKSYLWTEICTQEHELEKYTNLRWNSSDANAQKLGSVCETIRESLEENKKEFFDGDKNLGKKILSMITPENAHELMAENVPSN